MIYRHLLKNGTNDLITIDDLEKALKNSSLREMNVEYTDIYDTYDGYNLEKDIAYTLNKETGQYSHNPLSGHGGIHFGFYKFLEDFKNIDNQYIFSYKYVFRKNFSEPPVEKFGLYYTFEDTKSDENQFKEIGPREDNPYSADLQSMAQTYINNNYDLIKDKLDTYNYVFEIHDGNIVLVDFYRD